MVERWDKRRMSRRVWPAVEETLVAWTPEEAILCLERIESNRPRLRGPDRPWERGWLGYISYDLGAAMLLGRPPHRSNRILPYLRFHRVHGSSDRSAKIEENRIPSCLPAGRSDGRASYVRKVRAVQEELRNGNAYEVNLSQRWRWRFARRPDAAGLFRRICANLRPRYGFFERSGANAVMGFSPELFFSVDRGSIQAEPIKGTAPADDDGLLRSAKDRAELLMITDLFRNDLGKVCIPGSIRATGPAELRIPYARHLFSRVRGRLQPGAGLPQIVPALFPSGSVTGAPKIAACGIIDRLEPFAREEAFGAVGWVGRDRMDFAVSIRTALLCGRDLRYTAGGGITVYSDPGREYEESLLKASRFIESLPA